MALDINRMNYNVLYKTLDERELYFTTGTTYVTRVLNMQKNSTIKNPIISVYHFTSDERIDYVVYGELINHSSQSGVEYSILGWKIDKDSNMNEIGLKETAKEIVCSWESLTPVELSKSELLKIEISKFTENPTKYFIAKRGLELHQRIKNGMQSYSYDEDGIISDKGLRLAEVPKVKERKLKWGPSGLYNPNKWRTK